ncbi:sulfotransferase [Microbulbifer salipaludis]|uniref:Sulfotransferase n=1 Tax=Microbulbifer salipaludis TaxID=187980 RepID=A0ABS3E2D9_9GAMM|nr:sulfotransferase [Microbulbifer salipaludis]MBN8429472.1 sulfotransferase [Microbulbifer salipaludis]
MSHQPRQDFEQQASLALESPVFVIGPLRSGSTLLRLLLDHHPNMHMFGEFEGAVSQARGDRWPDLEDYWRFVKIDRQTSAMNLAIDPELDYPALVKDFLRQLYLRNPQPVVGASIHSRVDLLPRLWPNARYIHLYRDPRDVARSCIGMGWVGNVYEGAKIWCDFEKRRELLRTQEQPGQAIEVFYEQLVENPVKELSRLCEFLSLKFDPEMLKLDRDTTYSCPSKQYAEQWKSKSSAREIRWIELLTSEQMMKQGYQPFSRDTRALTIQEKLALKVQNRVYRMRYNIRKWGLVLWLQHVLARRTGIRQWVEYVKHRTNAIDRSLLK